MKLSKLSIPYKAVQKLGGTIIFLLIFAGGGLSASPYVLLGLLGLAFIGLVVIFGYEYLYWKKFEYRIEEDGLKILSGVIGRNDLDIPLKRIQNVDVNRNIVQRILGIAQVNVETAGGGSTEAALKFLDYEDAKEMQKQVRELKNRRKSDRSAEKDEGEQREDFALSNRDLAILSAVSIDARIIGALTVILSIAGGSLGSQLEGTSLQGLGLGIYILGGILVIGGVWLASAASTFVKYFDFKLYFHENALEYERGLLNRVSGTIPEEKVQDIIIEENFLQRYLGFASLEVETAGYTGGTQQDQTQIGSDTVIPLASRQEVEKFAEEIGGYTRPDYYSIDERAQTRYFRRYLLTGLLLGAVTFTVSFFVDVAWPAYIPSALIVLASKKAAQLKWENTGYALDSTHLFTRRGFWNRKTYVVPYFRVQNLMETQSIFQRRWNQSSIVVDTAGSVFSYPYIPDMDARTATELREHLFDSFLKSLKR